MDIKVLKKKRSSFKAKLTQFQNYLKLTTSCEKLSTIQLNELNARFTKIEELYSDFDGVQLEIESLTEIPEAEREYQERESFETQYFGAVASARDVLERHSGRSASVRSGGTGSDSHSGTVRFDHAGASSLKLPTIHLPTFSGRCQDWLEFHDTFNSLIHSDTSIPKINKFHYLRASLKDAAAEVIHSLDFSSDNYDIAWNLLCERYHNNKLLIHNHIQELFNIEQMHRESSKALRKIIDSVNKNLRALKSLKLPTEHWDALIIFMVSSKLDTNTIREWESRITDIPNLETFNSFLRNRAIFLETIEEAHPRRRHSDIIHTRTKTFIANSSPSFTYKPYSYNQHSPNQHSQNLRLYKHSCPLCKNIHAIYHCPKFKSLPIETRIHKVQQLKLCMNCLRSGHDHTKCKLSSCRICSKHHNTMLHLEPHHVETSVLPSKNNNNNKCVVLSSSKENTANMHNQSQSEITQTNVTLTSIHQSYVFLSTAVIDIIGVDGQKYKIRALLDNGSTSCFITRNLCDKLNIPIHSTLVSVEGLNGQSSLIQNSCNITISSLFEPYTQNINCYVVSQITQSLPTIHIDHKSLNIPQNIHLADPQFFKPSTIDILLNADIFWNILYRDRIYLDKNKPTLNKTKLGWLISGSMPIQIKNTHNSTVHCNFSHDLELREELNRFFELETVTSPRILCKEEHECEQIFKNTMTRQSDGRFVVTIPLKQSPNTLGDSYGQALSRFLSLERRFASDPKFKTKYVEFMKEYLDLNHMSINTNTSETDSYYLPHHGVLRESSLTTNLRVVFDGSAVTTTGVSFNHIQHVGPTVQDDLISILIRFRQHKYVVTSDIEKMYRNVLVTQHQRSLQQILWRFDPADKIKSYKLNTITYGTASAPYLATRCLAQLGQECSDSTIKETIIHDFYVDDYISGNDSIQELIRICKGIITELQTGQFHLRKWRSNNTHILEAIQPNNCTDELLILNNDSCAKTLGLLWASKTDSLLFSFSFNTNDIQSSKRSVLSTIAKIFDPLGLINPCTLQAKLLLQELWASNVAWDDALPSNILHKWNKFKQSLIHIKNINVPRRVIHDSPIKIEIHAFSDASCHAYSACIYIRSADINNTVKVSLIMAKSKVAPLKQTSTPRLELCGALLASRLADKVRTSLRLHIDNCFYWCDSTVVLGWIKTSKSTLKLFVLNRINEITEYTDPTSWRYVPTQLNPADIGSRGLDADQLRSSDLWWSGPNFLLQDESCWPQQPLAIHMNDLPETRVKCNFSCTQGSNFTNRFSNFVKLQHVTAYVLRFIHNCRNKSNKLNSYLKLSELTSANVIICKLVQQEIFPNEYSLLVNNKQLSTKNKLSSLSPFIDSHGVMRVGGRLKNSHYDYDTKHPIVLHASHNFTKLIFEHQHKLLMHAGPHLLLSVVRHKYWPIGGRNLARKIVKECIKCCRFSGKTIQPIMGNLPPARTHTEYVFNNTAVDYAGPVMLADRKGRGSRLIKSYVCVFVCLAVKAVHIELVTDLSCQGFIAALNRFISRRGRPANIFSDNGTNFVATNNELSKFLKNNSHQISSFASDLSINFRFAPAYSPHFNGLAESSVKSIKRHLKKILSNAHLTYEEMNTTLIQIEGILNSRPLTPLSSNPNDLVALTPAHFLIGRTLTNLPLPQVNEQAPLHTLSRYERIKALAAHFWQRYQNEYVTELQLRNKWRKSGEQLTLGDMVIVKDERLPPSRWLLGRVTHLYPGSDGISRIADVSTYSGTLRRAYNRLCRLPSPQLEQQGVPRAGE